MLATVIRKCQNGFVRVSNIVELCARTMNDSKTGHHNKEELETAVILFNRLI